MRRSTLIFFFIFVGLFFSAYGNELVPFGNGEGFQYVIAVAAPEDETESAALFFRGREFLETLASERRLPNAAISLALTTNDYSRLPDQLRPAVPEGAAELISQLERTGGAVILLLPEEEAGVTIVKCGVRGKTSPPELLSAVANQLESSGLNWCLEESHLDLYRIGWVPEHHILKAYFDAGIPAIAISTSADVFPAIVEAVRSLSAQVPSPAFSSQNYTVLEIPKFLRAIGITSASAILAGGRFAVLSERLVVSAIIFFFSLFLLYLCVLFLSSPEIRRMRVKKIFEAIPLAVLFVVVNSLAMRLGGHLASWLVALRFGKGDTWILIPRAALFTKLSFAFFLSSLASGVKNRFQAGRDPISLGYVASIASLVNIFVFFAIEFSLSGYFIICYILISACNYIKKTSAKTVLTILAAAVFTHLYAQIAAGNTAAISALYSNEGAWNMLAAFFILPFQLMFMVIIERTALRLKFSFKLSFPSKKRTRAHIYAVQVLGIAFLALSVSALFVSPAWSKEKPLPVLIRQSITEEGLNVTLDSSASLKHTELARMQNGAQGFLSPSDLRPNDFISVEFSSREFLDREIYELVINPTVNPQKIDVRISSNTGIAVNVSPMPFHLAASGREALFSSSENPETPMRVSFITGTADTLQAEISCWSVDNPFGFYIEDESIAASSLLFIKKEIALSEDAMQ